MILSNARCQIFFFHTNSRHFPVEITQPCVLEEVRNDNDKRNSRRRMVKGEKKPIIYREKVRREWSNIADGAGQWLINLSLQSSSFLSLAGSLNSVEEFWFWVFFVLGLIQGAQYFSLLSYFGQVWFKKLNFLKKLFSGNSSSLSKFGLKEMAVSIFSIFSVLVIYFLLSWPYFWCIGLLSKEGSESE